MYIRRDRYDEVLAALDVLEGYEEGNEADSEYVRETVTVIDESGKEVEAYTYYWNRPTGLGEHITSGDLAHLAAAETKKTGRIINRKQTVPC
ncbi:gamma-glutamylcyclotransferase [Salibacterium sp. K-3]